MRKLSVLLMLFVLLSACDKRYEDGPCLSFVKAENRLCGLWSFQNMRLDQSEAGRQTMDSISLFRLSFFMNSEKALFMSISDTSGTVLAEGLVRYDDRITELSFYPATIEGFESNMLPLYNNIPAFNTEHLWLNKRLTRKEIIIETLHLNVVNTLSLSIETDYPHL